MKENNLLNFVEYSELKNFNKPTKRTEVGGDVINENVELVALVAAIVNDAKFTTDLTTFIESLKPTVKTKILELLKKSKK